MTALLAQNKGAGKSARIREGFRCGLWIEMIYALFICEGLLCRLRVR